MRFHMPLISLQPCPSWFSCAIEDEFFDFGAQAASKIEYSLDRDTQKVRVIEARRRVSSDSEPFLSEVTRFYRSSMACFAEVR